MPGPPPRSDPPPGGGGTRRALIAILAVAAALAFFRIGHQSYWDDEISTIAVSSAPFVKRLVAIVLLDVSPPLYYALFGFWVQVSSAEWWTRAFSALCWLAGIAFVYATGLRTVGARATRTGCALLAILPLGIYAAQETRPYALFFLATSAFAWSLARADEPGARAPRLAVWLSGVAVLYSHYYGLFVFASLATWALVRLSTTPNRPPILRDGRLRALAIAAACWLPWLPALLIQLRAGQGWRPRLGVLPILGRSLVYLTSGHTPRLLPFSHWDGGAPTLLLVVSCAAFLVLIGAAAVGGRGRAETGGPPRVGLLWFWLVGPMALLVIGSRVTPIFNPRALIGLAGASALLVGYGVVSLAARRRWVAAAPAAVLIGCALASLALYYFHPAYEKQNWRALAERIAGDAESGDVALFHSRSRALALQYYANERFPVRWALDWPQREELSPEETRERLIQAADEATAACNRIWFVDYHGVGFDREVVMESRIAERFAPIRTRTYYADEYGFRVTLYERKPPDEIPVENPGTVDPTPFVASSNLLTR